MNRKSRPSPRLSTHNFIKEISSSHVKQNYKATRFILYCLDRIYTCRLCCGMMIMTMIIYFVKWLTGTIAVDFDNRKLPIRCVQDFVRLQLNEVVRC